MSSTRLVLLWAWPLSQALSRAWMRLAAIDAAQALMLAMIVLCGVFAVLIFLSEEGMPLGGKKATDVQQ